MKKAILVVMLSLVMASTAFAMASIRMPKNTIVVSPDTVIPDNPNWVGEKYGNYPVAITNDVLGFNRNYVTKFEITLMSKEQKAYVKIRTGYFPTKNYLVNLPPEDEGKFGTAAYNAPINFANKFFKNSKVDRYGQPVLFQETGGLINPKHLNTWGYDPYVKTSQGHYPRWQIWLYVEMTMAEYTSQFKPAFDAWNANTVKLPLTVNRSFDGGQHLFYGNDN